MFFLDKMQYLQIEYPWHVSFIVHCHPQIPTILHTLIKLGNNYVLDE